MPILMSFIALAMTLVLSSPAALAKSTTHKTKSTTASGATAKSAHKKSAKHASKKGHKKSTSYFLSGAQIASLKPADRASYLKKVQEVLIDIEKKTSPQGWGGVTPSKSFALKIGLPQAQAQALPTVSETIDVSAKPPFEALNGDGTPATCDHTKGVCVIAGWNSCRGADGRCKIPGEAKCGSPGAIGVSCSPVFGYNSKGALACQVGNFNNASSSCSTTPNLSVKNLSEQQVKELEENLTNLNVGIQGQCGGRVSGDCGIWKQKLASAQSEYAPLAKAPAEAGDVAVPPPVSSGAPEAAAGSQEASAVDTDAAPAKEYETPSSEEKAVVGCKEPKNIPKEFEANCTVSCGDGRSALAIKKFEVDKKKGRIVEKIYFYTGKVEDLEGMDKKSFQKLIDKESFIQCKTKENEDAQQEFNKLYETMVLGGRCDGTFEFPMMPYDETKAVGKSEKKWHSNTTCGLQGENKRQLTFDTGFAIPKKGYRPEAKSYHVKLERRVINFWSCDSNTKAPAESLAMLLDRKNLYCADSAEAIQQEHLQQYKEKIAKEGSDSGPSPASSSDAD